MFDDIVKSMKAGLYDRVSSPLIASFVISWLIWNFRLVTILISHATLGEKFHYIDYQLYSNAADRTISLLIGPLLTALAYIFIWPYFGKRIYEFYELRQKELREIKVRIEDETPMTAKQSRDLKNQFVDLQFKYQKDVEMLESQIGRLRTLLDNEVTKGVSNATPVVETSDTDEPAVPLSDIEQAALKQLATNERRAADSSEEDLLKSITSDRLANKSALESLDEKSLVKREYSQRNRQWEYGLTKEGRRTLIKIDVN